MSPRLKKKYPKFRCLSFHSLALSSSLFKQTKLIFFGLLFFTSNSFSQDIPCDFKAYLNGSELRSLDLNTAQTSPIISNQEIELTAMGYNVIDERIYALDRNTLHLLKIDLDGNVTDLGFPPGLDLDLNYVAGDTAPGGKRLFVIGQNKTTGVDERFYTIRLSPPYSAGFLSITSIQSVGLGDITFDPLLDKAYGYDNRQKKVVSLSTGGNVTSFSTTNTSYTISSLFFDEKGTLYGVSNGELVEFNKHTGNVTSTRDIFGGESDGCSCPYQIDFYQIITPQETVPCSEAIITYYFDNRAGTAYGQIGVESILPDGFTITEIIEKPFFGTIENGVGGNILDVENMQVLLGVDSFSIRVYLDETVSGSYDLQSNSFFFPQAFGTEIPSDNPFTEEEKDPTAMQIITDEKDLFEEDILYLCEGGSLNLETGLQGVSFLWSDGSTNPVLAVSDPGEYWVEIQSDCQVYRDSIQVLLEAAPLFIELGEDLEVNIGQVQSLNYSTNGENLTFNWSSDLPQYVSCQECPNPTIQPLENAQYSVTITNESGCTATDNIAVQIRDQIKIYAPNVFSPNGDGINDRFFLQSDGNFQIKTMNVFDRWGNIVFQISDVATNDLTVGWNGKSNQRIQENGVYLWVAEIALSDTMETFSGSVLLLGK